MATATRFVAACAVVLIVGSSISAQIPTAPRPHPTLDELVKEYKRFGLPLPPPNAELVRIERIKRLRDDNPDERPQVMVSYLIGFKLLPSRPGKDSRYWVGDGSMWNEWIDPARVQPVKPTSEALHLVSMRCEFSLHLAVQCKLRGWNDFADAVYAHARTSERELLDAVQRPDDEWDIEEVLPSSAWRSWEGQLTQPGSDRKEILKHLKKLADEVEWLRSPATGQLLSSLETTVAPRKPKPGTVEALIDDLTEYWLDEEDSSNTKGQEAYWKLVELGFDAVPTLIDHVNDDRLSRACVIPRGKGEWFYRLTVGHLCSRLLFDLSGRTIGGGYWQARGDRLNPDKAREWFDAAKKIGEEKWLLDHAILDGDPDVIVNEIGRPEWLIVRVIGTKYPARLPAIYRAMLRKKSSSWNTAYVNEILASKLPREQKIALFEEGSAHEDIGHRTNAIGGLADVDQALFRKHLLKMLKEIPVRLEMKKKFPVLHPIVALVARADDRDCWDALVVATKKASPEDRISVIIDLLPHFPPDEIDPHRRMRLRVFVQFLDDSSADPDDMDHVQVRDFAAYYLAGLFRFPVDRDFDSWVFYNRDRGPLSRLLLREAVRRLVQRELSCPEK